MTNDRQSGIIHLREILPVLELINANDSFALRKDRPAIWLQKICIWVLRKLKAYGQIEVTTYKTCVIGERGEHFMNNLTRHYANLHEDLWTKPKRLIIGSKTFSEVMRIEECMSIFSFQSEYKLPRDKDPDDFPGKYPSGPYWTCYGLRVDIIPWMEGMVFLPN